MNEKLFFLFLFSIILFGGLVSAAPQLISPADDTSTQNPSITFEAYSNDSATSSGVLYIWNSLGSLFTSQAMDNETYILYQEDADSYLVTGTANSSYPLTNAYDNNYSTYAKPENGQTINLYSNYTKPPGAVGGKWQRKTGDAQFPASLGNHTINPTGGVQDDGTIISTCWAQDPLQLRISANLVVGSHTDFFMYCWTGSGWNRISYGATSYGDFAAIYEEDMFWDIGYYSLDYGLPPGTYEWNVLDVTPNETATNNFTLIVESNPYNSIVVDLISPSPGSEIEEGQQFVANITNNNGGIESYVFNIYDLNQNIVYTETKTTTPTNYLYENTIFSLGNWVSPYVGGMTSNGTNYIFSDLFNLVATNDDFSSISTITLSGGSLANPFGVAFYNDTYYVSGYALTDSIELYNTSGVYQSSIDVSSMTGGDTIGGIVVIDDYIYFSSYANDRIFKIYHNGTYISNVSGIYAPEGSPISYPDFGYLVGITWDGNSIWATSANDAKIYELDKDTLQPTGETFSYTGGGLTFFDGLHYDSSLDKFYTVSGVQLLVQEHDLNNPSTNYPDVTFTGTAGVSYGIELHNGIIYYTDWSPDRIRVYYQNGTSTGDAFDIGAAGLGEPRGITTNGEFLWVTDNIDDEIYAFYMNGAYASSFDTNADGVEDNAALAYYDGKLYVTEGGQDVHSYYINGTYIGVAWTGGSEVSSGIFGLTTDGTYWWAQTDGSIYKYYFNGTLIGFEAAGYGRGLGYENNRLIIIGSNGNIKIFPINDYEEYPSNVLGQFTLNSPPPGNYTWDIGGTSEFGFTGFSGGAPEGGGNYSYPFILTQDIYKTVCSDGEITMGQATGIAGILLVILLVGTVLATLVMSFTGMIDLNKLGSELTLDKLPVGIAVIGLTYLVLATMALVLGPTVCQAFGG